MRTATVTMGRPRPLPNSGKKVIGASWVADKARMGGMDTQAIWHGWEWGLCSARPYVGGTAWQNPSDGLADLMTGSQGPETMWAIRSMSVLSSRSSSSGFTSARTAS